MTPEEVREVVGNGIFTIDFVKKDGTPRTTNARLGVTKHLRGGGDTTAHKPNILTVFEMKAQQYRKISCDRITRITCNGRTIENIV